MLLMTVMKKLAVEEWGTMGMESTRKSESTTRTFLQKEMLPSIS
jgi:hypothetical protein